MVTLHGTCVSLAGSGVLLRGRSGAGKSDLALRLIDGGGLLVADDRVVIEADGLHLRAKAPREAANGLAGYLEVRGIGILPVPHVPDVRLALVVDLVEAGEIDRLPPPVAVEFLGRRLPAITLWPFEVSSCAKLRLALRAVTDPARAALDLNTLQEGATG